MLRTMAQRVAHDAPAANRFAASGAALLIGTLTANVLSYAFFLVLSRRLDSASLGAVGALVNLSVIATVPALGLQLVAARLEASERALGGLGTHRRQILRAAVALSAVIAIVLLAATPVLTTLFSVDVLALLALAAAMVPMTLTYGAQGVLQGNERFATLSVVLALSGVSKVAAALGASAVRASTPGTRVTTVMWLYAAATAVVALVAIALLRGKRGTRLRPPPSGAGHLTRLVAAAVVPTSGLLFLASLDVLLARHQLTAADSGSYTVGALFGKAAFWGISFLATLFYPAMTDPARRRAALLRALGVTTAAGIAGVAVSRVLGGPLVHIVGGADYAHLASDIWRFTAFGVLLSLVQVLAYAGLAAATLRMGVAMWLAGVVAVVATLATASTVTDVVNVMLWCAALLAVAGLVIERRTLVRPR